jgi:hypothetical protein
MEPNTNQAVTENRRVLRLSICGPVGPLNSGSASQFTYLERHSDIPRTI